jgi:ABC-2 type transport system ATP-binding protein
VEFVQYNRPRLDDVFIAHTGRRIQDDIQKDSED